MVGAVRMRVKRIDPEPPGHAYHFGSIGHTMQNGSISHALRFEGGLEGEKDDVIRLEDISSDLHCYARVRVAERGEVVATPCRPWRREYREEGDAENELVLFGMTEDLWRLCLKNVGIDLDCGSCAELLFTGASIHPHTCGRKSNLTVTEEKGMPGITYDVEELEALRKEIGQWADRNFGHTSHGTSHSLMRCAAGICEELGELQGAIENVGAFEAVEADIYDAVGDISIYALDLMWKFGLLAQDVLLHDKEPCSQEHNFIKDAAALEKSQPASFQDSAIDSLMRGMTIHVGRLSHHVLKQDQGIRKNEDHKEGVRYSLCHIFRLLYRFCAHSSVDLNSLIKTVAGEVLKRDWVKNPDLAHQVAEEEASPT